MELLGKEGIEYLSGGSGDDVIYGNYGSDFLQGGDGTTTSWGDKTTTLCMVAMETIRFTATGVMTS